MKRTIYVIIAAIICSLLYSCNDKLQYLDNGDNASNDKAQIDFEYTDSDDKPVEYNSSDGRNLQYENGYLYFYGGASDYINGSSNTLMRYNVKTGNLTSVCADPLCGHNTSDCLFFGLRNFYYITNNKISFNRTYLYNTNSDSSVPESWLGFVTYDMESSEFTVHKTFDDYSELGGYIYQLYVDNYRYFFDMNVYDEKTDSYMTVFSRMDLETSEVVTYSEDISFDETQLYTNPFSQRFLFELDGRIYMTDGKTIYSINLDMTDKQVHTTGNFLSAANIKTDGKYIYYGSKSESIHRMNFDGTGDIDLGILTEDFTITENYIYYITPDEVPIGKNRVRGYIGDEIVLYGSEVRRCNHDGTDNESVFKFDGELANYRFAGSAYCFVGNYIYGAYGYWTDSNGDGAFEDGDYYSSSDNDDFNIMRINITTGEIYYIKEN